MECDNCGAPANTYTGIDEKRVFFCGQDCLLELQYFSDRGNVR